MKYAISLLFVLLVSLALAFGQAANSGGNTTGGADNGTAAISPPQSNTGDTAATQANPNAGEQAPATTGTNEKHHMPQTASPLPELALLGLSSLGVGALLRKRRKA
jgi:LPXTG-motif cell wall-anchored protein